MEGGVLNAVMHHDNYDADDYDQYDHHAEQESDGESVESDESFGAQQRRNNFQNNLDRLLQEKR